MTALGALLLFFTMMLLAALPSTSVAVVITRSVTGGLPHGIAAAAGIVVGDLVFVLLALFGLSAIAESLGSFFVIIKILGGAYLIWLGVGLLRARPSGATAKQEPSEGPLLISFAAGLLLTLGDLKAIFFYVSFFPMVLDLDKLSSNEIATIIAITILAVGGIKIFYAILAQRIMTRHASHRFARPTQIAAGTCMIGAGTALIVKQ